MKMTKRVNIPGNLDWELLKRFNICVDSRSFAEAAAKIGTSQAALLKQISTLEEQVGAELFVRVAKNRSHDLTAEGKHLHSITERIFDLINKQVIEKKTKAHQEEKHKQIKIYTTPGLSLTLLSPLIIRFLNEYNNVNFEVITKINPLKIKKDEIIIRNNINSQPGLEITYLMTLHISFYASKTYLKRYGFPKKLGDLINHRVFSTKYFNMVSNLEYSSEQDSIISLKPRIQSDYISFLIDMAQRDQGILELADIHPSASNLIKIPHFKPDNHDIYVGYLKADIQDEIINKFIEYLKSNCIEKFFKRISP